MGEKSVTHENYLKICEALNLLTSVFPRPDGTKPADWNNLTEESKEASVKAFKEIMEGDFQNAEDLHNLWMRIKVDNGWTLGEFNLEKKTHPCIIPYADLIPSEKAKDEIWWEISRIMKASL